MEMEPPLASFTVTWRLGRGVRGAAASVRDWWVPNFR